MNRLRPILTLSVLTALLACTACREDVIMIDSLEKEMFLRESTEGIYRNGEALFKFNPQSHQRAANPGRMQYRIQTDGQDTCLNVILDALPQSAGVHITTSIDYRSPGKLVSSMSHLECSRKDGDLIWLWSAENYTGIIINTSEL